MNFLSMVFSSFTLKPLFVFLPFAVKLIGCGRLQLESASNNAPLGRSQVFSVGGNPMTIDRIATLGLVALVVDPTRTDRKGVCSGTLVQKNRVLTAAHCFANPLGKPTIVQFGIDAFDAKTLSVKVKSWSRPSSADLALVELETEAPKTWKSAKILTEFPIGFLPQSGFGAGFGRASTQTPLTAGIARELGVQFQNVSRGTPIAVALSGQGKGFCYGDSGGPLFVTLKGEIYVIGVLSNGAQTCETGIDNFTLTSFYGNWLSKHKMF